MVRDLDVLKLCLEMHQSIWVFPKIGVFPPKSSILIGVSIINHPFWGTHIFWKHPFGGRAFFGRYILRSQWSIILINGCVSFRIENHEQQNKEFSKKRNLTHDINLYKPEIKEATAIMNNLHTLQGFESFHIHFDSQVWPPWQIPSPS